MKTNCNLDYRKRKTHSITIKVILWILMIVIGLLLVLCHSHEHSGTLEMVGIKNPIVSFFASISVLSALIAKGENCVDKLSDTK